MQVKKFEAPTMSEALKLVKAELGPDAIILSTKKHRKGFGLLSKPLIEITAAISERALMNKKITERILPESTKQKLSKFSAAKQKQVYDEFGAHYQERVLKKKGLTAGKLEASAEFSSGTSTADTSGVRASSVTAYGAAMPSAAVQQSYVRNGQIVSTNLQLLEEELATVKSMVEQLKSTQAQILAKTDKAGQDAEAQIADSRIPDQSTHQVYVEFQNLLQNGVDKQYASHLIKQLTFEMPRAALESSEQIVEHLAREMMQAIKVNDPLQMKPSDPQRVFALIGPTGVGKTTTLAKLASLALLKRNLKVGLINLDLYKIDSENHFSTYAKILNVPYRNVTNIQELDRALTDFKPLHVVFIDTKGCSQKDSDSMMHTKSLLEEFQVCPPQVIESLLVLSSTTRDQELYEVVTRFKVFNPSGIIFSKLDESSVFGCLYNVSMKTQLPLTYFTVGQRVPEDIETASVERVVGSILDL